MTTPHLRIAKRMMMVHGRLRPVIEVVAMIDEVDQAALLEHFGNETLFKRTAYANGFSDGGLQPTPALSRTLSTFLKNDACPEITVKTLLAGQKYEGQGLWDLLCFDYIAKRAFDSLQELAEGTRGFGKADIYLGFEPSAEMAAFGADTALEMAAGPAAIAEGGIEGMANAA